ncbi:MAG TPA: hypothetical protein PKX74_16245, partial [Leptospiraceae bacterium]|nr:hypothetical protein [Leptospiraceae bacterium]
MNTEIDFLRDMMKRLDLFFLEADDQGKIRAISGGLIRLLGYPAGHEITLQSLFDETTVAELFGRKLSAWQNGLRFYRAKVKNSAGEEIFFDVSGYMEI